MAVTVPSVVVVTTDGSLDVHTIAGRVRHPACSMSEGTVTACPTVMVKLAWPRDRPRIVHVSRGADGVSDEQARESRATRARRVRHIGAAP
jgi:hypothetical protein